MQFVKACFEIAKRMIKTKLDAIGVECMRSDKVLAVSDEDKKNNLEKLSWEVFEHIAWKGPE